MQDVCTALLFLHTPCCGSTSSPRWAPVTFCLFLNPNPKPLNLIELRPFYQPPLPLFRASSPLRRQNCRLRCPHRHRNGTSSWRQGPVHGTKVFVCSCAAESYQG